MLELADASGSFTSNVFNNNTNYTALNDLSEGSLIKIQGVATTTNASLRPNPSLVTV